jgi:type 1 glutamine amidotransferase
MRFLTFFIWLTVVSLTVEGAPALRVFIRGGKKSHGPGAHEHDKFLKEWKVLLAGRGMVTDGAMDWPDATQFAQTDVLVMYAQEGANATPEQKKNVAEFTKRGGGLVVIHTAVVGNDPAWWKSVIGGAWVQGKTKWREGPMELMFAKEAGQRNAITEGLADFKMDDEIYYNLDVSPDIHVLASSDTGKGSPKIQEQVWTYEKEGYRAFVCIPGHLFTTFERPDFRVMLLRGIAWAGKRKDINEYCIPPELEALRVSGK